MGMRVLLRLGLFSAMLSCFAEAGAATMSVFSKAFPDLYVRDAAAALELYVGRWNGVQTLLFDGKVLGEGSFTQTCVARGDGPQMRVVSTGLITYGSESATSRSVMFIDKDGTLRTDVISEDGSVESYYGKIENNSIYWLPKNMFVTYDYQKDSFFVTEKGVDMYCDGLRYIDVPQKRGYLGTATVLTKMDGSFSRDDSAPGGGMMGSPIR